MPLRTGVVAANRYISITPARYSVIGRLRAMQQTTAIVSYAPTDKTTPNWEYKSMGVRE